MAEVLDAGLQAQPAASAVDAGPAALPGATLRASWDGGAWEFTSATDGGVAPRAVFLFTAAVALSDLRVRLLDDDDRMLPSHALLGEGPDGGTSVTVEPTAPLPAHRCCRFAVDGELHAWPTGLDGRPFLPLEVRFSVASDPKSAAPARKPRRRHRRHPRR